MASYSDSNINREGGARYFNKLLRKMSSWGMDTDDMLMRNSQAVGVNQTPTPVSTSENMYDVFSRNASASLFQNKSISYLDRSYAEKLRILREYSRKDEIRDFITIVADESIIYDENEDFIKPITLPNEFGNSIKDAYYSNFKKIFNRFGFNDGILAWNYFRTLLIDGYLAFEIVYDDKQRDVIGFQQIDPSTLLPGIDPTNGDRIWIQYPEAPEFRRILLDSCIIYISYSSASEYSETSYVENLIRPYNQLKLLEQTRIMFNITNAMMHKKFIIPVGGMSRQMQEQQIAKLVADYKDEITWDDREGKVSINGSPHIPYSKEYWFPESESGTPQVELINQEGHNLNENDILTWFYNALKRASKIPFTRFDKTNGGGSIFGDVSEMSRDDLTFFYFVQRIRTIFKEIIIKPWKIKMILDYPDLREDENFLNQIDVVFNGVNLFHEWKRLNNLSKRTEILSNLTSSILDNEGNPYFHIEWLVRNILKLDEDEIKENERWKKEIPTKTEEDVDDDIGNFAEESTESDSGLGAFDEPKLDDDIVESDF
jgi:hypothetical protein